ncbi:MAG: hypothetical protein ABR555_10700 [Pyrinomonadaceae bacterium]
MKRTSLLLATFTLISMVVVSVMALAQEPQQPAGNVIVQRATVVQGPEGARVPQPDGNFIFVASEIGFGGKVVKGAPYSAQAVTETVQTLGDGNRIVNKVATSLYRDSEGRTRREQKLKAIGGITGSSEPLETIFINDPVSGISYVLDSRSHIARKTSPFRFQQKIMPTVPKGAESKQFEFQIVPVEPSVVVTRKAPTVLPATAAPVENGNFTYTTDAAGGTSVVLTRNKIGPNPTEVKEDLGKQIIEGVEAEGSRTTMTIPAGEIGNERAIEIINERWYSPDLQMVIMSRHSDPRFGETIYRLTNIDRTEPVNSLFEVPSEYTIKEGMRSPAPGAPMPARIRKPVSPE